MKLVTKYGGMTHWLEDTGGNIQMHVAPVEEANAIIAKAHSVVESHRYIGYNRCVDGRGGITSPPKKRKNGSLPIRRRKVNPNETLLCRLYQPHDAFLHPAS